MLSHLKLPASRPALLIAAQSGRALAAAALRAGYVPLVADLFGDEDMCAMAARYRRLTGRFGTGLTEGDVMPALDALAESWPTSIEGLVLGSGFERSPRLIAALEKRFRLIGASADAVAVLKDPFAFARLLRRLGVPHPAIGRSQEPGAQGVWLSKARGGSGGGHIRVARAGPPQAGRYVQRCVPGVPHAAAFLADGRHASIVAFTEQWTAPSHRAPWRYGGAVEPANLPAAVRAGVGNAIASIVEAVGLTGLASADFLVDGDRWWLLEVNPRPGATLDVLDRRATPLLLRHVEACAGHLGTAEERPALAAGSMILYAPRAAMTRDAPAWPDFVADRPHPGMRIGAGAPICTVAATADDAAAVKAELARRSGEILRMLYNKDRIGERLPHPTERQWLGEAAR
jgi:predicted ATP-grasp superfamily ATP-dependent carboligase